MSYLGLYFGTLADLALLLSHACHLTPPNRTVYWQKMQRTSSQHGLADVVTQSSPMFVGGTTTQLLAPQPVKPRRRQRSIISLETFRSGRPVAPTGDWTSSSPQKQAPEDVGMGATAQQLEGASHGQRQSPLASQDAVEELFQIMRRTSLANSPPRRYPAPAPLRTTPDSVGWNCGGFPSSPVARNTRNPIVLNTSFQNLS